MTGSNFSSWFNLGEGTFYSEKYPGLNIRANPLNQYLVADTMIDWVSFKSIKQYKPDSNSLKLGTIFTLTDLGTDPTVVLPEGFQSGDILRQGEYEVKFGVTQKGFMNKTQLFFVEAHYIKDGKDVIKWSAPIDVEFRFKAFRRLY